MHKQPFFCHFVAEFKFDGFSVDMTRSMVAMRDVSLLFLFIYFLAGTVCSLYIIMYSWHFVSTRAVANE